MRTLKLTIAYDGSRYAGWQTQRVKSGKFKVQREQPTIQGTLEAVLSRIAQEPVRVIGSGRTDAGVHAEAQIAHLKTGSAISPERLLRSVNQLLPPDIAVTGVEEVRRPFHARFDAAAKRYRYRIFTGPVVPPFIRPYVHHARVPLNVRTMRGELRALEGAHDFRAFARASGDGRRTTHRTIIRAHLTRRGRELHLDVEGDGFLHTMVRSIAGTLMDVGRGHLPPGTMREMLVRRDRRLAGTTAPASGLTLVSVTYK